MKIHFLSDSLRMNSGFAIVAKNLMLEFMKRGHQVTMTGLQQSFLKETNYGIECYPLNVGHISEEVKYFITLMNIKPDIVFNIFGSDTGSMDNLLEIPLKAGIKNRIWYCPVDSKDIGTISYGTLKRYTESDGKLVAQCEWGYNQFIKAGINVVDYIYHGYNPNVFKKLSDDDWIDNKIIDSFINQKVGLMIWNINKYDNKESKYEYINYPINDIKKLIKGKYVFGFLGANFGLRKRIERLLKAYSLFIKGNKQLTDRTLLWLHTLPVSNQGINLLNIIKKLGIEKNVIISYNGENEDTWSENNICKLYNIFDCHVSASSGEGFSLPILESMACSVPNIGTNICSFPELIGNSEEGRGLLVDCELQMVQDESFRGLVNEKKLCEAMIKMHAYWDKNKCKCTDFASNYTWSKVSDDWIELFKNEFDLK